MSAVFSAESLNDFISPGVACIKPIETLPKQDPQKSENPYEVTTEDKVADENAPPAQISLTDCLACSGCVTSAEAVLVSLQSHAEVLNALDACPAIHPARFVDFATQTSDETLGGGLREEEEGKVFIASVSPQVRASIAATYCITEAQAGNLISQLLSGPHGLASGGAQKNGFTWVIDTNAMREACLVLGADEALTYYDRPTDHLSQRPGSATYPPNKPILTSACPGWICYAEKTHPHILPHLSRLKSPQALTGTLLKTILSRRFGIHPSKIWHLTIMPCFDKKLEASREELTDLYWRPSNSSNATIRDTDCVITARELVMLADTRGISLPSLPLTPLPSRTPFPDPELEKYLFPRSRRRNQRNSLEAGSSGGYLHHILCTLLAQHPGSTLHTQRGRNGDVVEFSILSSLPFSNNNPPLNQNGSNEHSPIFKAARYYGFRNIQNLVRKLRPPEMSKPRMPGARKPGASKEAGGLGLDYFEVMACPGGCTNGGGQIKATDTSDAKRLSAREWLGKVDEAYFSASEDEDGSAQEDVEMAETDPGVVDDIAGGASKHEVINGIDVSRVRRFLEYWVEATDIPLDSLAYTSFRSVESDVGKVKQGSGDPGRALEVASKW